MHTLATPSIACLAMFIAFPAHAANWQYVTTDSTDSVWYVDIETVQDRSGFRYFWVKVDASLDQTVQYNEDKRHYKAKCINRKLELLSFIEYDINGKITNTDSFADYIYTDVGMEAVAPDTVGDTLLKAVCR